MLHLQFCGFPLFPQRCSSFPSVELASNVLLQKCFTLRPDMHNWISHLLSLRSPGVELERTDSAPGLPLARVMVCHGQAPTFSFSCEDWQCRGAAVLAEVCAGPEWPKMVNTLTTQSIWSVWPLLAYQTFALERPKWTSMVHSGAFWPEEVHATCWSIWAHQPYWSHSWIWETSSTTLNRAFNSMGDKQHNTKPNCGRRWGVGSTSFPSPGYCQRKYEGSSSASPQSWTPFLPSFKPSILCCKSERVRVYPWKKPSTPTCMPATP